jgi:hypothetical protein
VTHIDMAPILWQLSAAVALKRSCPPSPDAEPQPQPLPLMALPELMWGVLGDIMVHDLQEALTTFPRARTLRLTCDWRPSFIPPSLTGLSIDLTDGGPVTPSLLSALPGMLEARGARLDRLELILPSKFEYLSDGLVHLAEALRCCAPTLKALSLSAAEDESVDDANDEADGYDDPVERLRMQWAGVLTGVSACRELQVLLLPRIEVEPLFPPGTVFARLTHLEISDYERERPPDAGVMGLWEVVEPGGLTALARLSVRFEGRWGGMEEVCVLVALVLGADEPAGLILPKVRLLSTDRLLGLRIVRNRQVLSYRDKP